ADEYAAVSAEARNIEPRERRVLADVVLGGAVRLLPQHLAAVHVVGRDAIVGRLDQRDRPLQECADRPRAEPATAGRPQRTRPRTGTARQPGCAERRRRIPVIAWTRRRRLFG